MSLYHVHEVDFHVEIRRACTFVTRLKKLSAENDTQRALRPCWLWGSGMKLELGRQMSFSLLGPSLRLLSARSELWWVCLFFCCFVVQTKRWGWFSSYHSCKPPHAHSAVRNFFFFLPHFLIIFSEARSQAIFVSVDSLPACSFLILPSFSMPMEQSTPFRALSEFSLTSRPKGRFPSPHACRWLHHPDIFDFFSYLTPPNFILCRPLSIDSPLKYLWHDLRSSEETESRLKTTPLNIFHPASSVLNLEDFLLCNAVVNVYYISAWVWTSSATVNCASLFKT